MPVTVSIIASVRATLDTGVMSPKPRVVSVTEAKIKGVETIHAAVGLVSQREYKTPGRDLGKEHISQRPEQSQHQVNDDDPH